MLHFQVKHLQNLVQNFIDSHQEIELKACLTFIETSYANGNSQVRNAIDVSIVEELEFENSGKINRLWGWDVMPPKLQELYIAFHLSPPNK